MVFACPTSVRFLSDINQDGCPALPMHPLSAHSMPVSQPPCLKIMRGRCESGLQGHSGNGEASTPTCCASAHLPPQPTSNLGLRHCANISPYSTVNIDRSASGLQCMFLVANLVRFDAAILYEDNITCLPLCTTHTTSNSTRSLAFCEFQIAVHTIASRTRVHQCIVLGPLLPGNLR